MDRHTCTHPHAITHAHTHTHRITSNLLPLCFKGIYRTITFLFQTQIIFARSKRANVRILGNFELRLDNKLKITPDFNTACHLELFREIILIYHLLHK